MQFSWTPQTGSPTGLALFASSADGSHIVAAVQGASLYTSADFGVTWNAGGVIGPFTSLASLSDGTHLVVASSNGIYLSGDPGTTWVAQSSLPSASWQSVASSSDGSRVVAVAGNGLVYTYAAGTGVWIAQSQAPSVPWRAVASSSDGSQLIAAAGGKTGQVYTYTDSCGKWTPASGPPSAGWSAVASSTVVPS